MMHTIPYAARTRLDISKRKKLRERMEIATKIVEMTLWK